MGCSHIIIFTLPQYELFKLVKLVSSKAQRFIPNPMSSQKCSIYLFIYYLVSLSYFLNSSFLKARLKPVSTMFSPHLANLLLCGQYCISIENVSFAPGKWSRCAFPYSSCQVQLQILNIYFILYIKLMEEDFENQKENDRIV